MSEDTDRVVDCPWCGLSFPLRATVRNLTICPTCLHGVTVDVDSVRRASTADVNALTADELLSIRVVKKKARVTRAKAAG